MSESPSIDYAITFACYNQVEYTRQCVDSMKKHGDDLARVVAVDNGSTDDTREYLSGLPLGGCIFNKDNLGCGVAWNQGVLAHQAEWSIVMNNDVLVSHHWIENLIGAAQRNDLKIVSPALIEGPLDYDFDAFAEKASVEARDALRIGDRHAVCLAVHNSVWMEIGYFRPVPKLLGYEDTLFFHEVDKAGIRTGITGASWLHHFGSITQTAMKVERGLSQQQGLPYRYNYRLLQQRWLDRKLAKRRRVKQRRQWRQGELDAYGLSLHGVRENGTFVWR
ncbi:MAG TPA: glycosyltransferase [Pseudomonadales bacterium]|nr:glycosyltransferase [Pseudomonadales bacterium]